MRDRGSTYRPGPRGSPRIDSPARAHLVRDRSPPRFTPVHPARPRVTGRAQGALLQEPRPQSPRNPPSSRRTPGSSSETTPHRRTPTSAPQAAPIRLRHPANAQSSAARPRRSPHEPASRQCANTEIRSSSTNGQAPPADPATPRGARHRRRFTVQGAVVNAEVREAYFSRRTCNWELLGCDSGWRQPSFWLHSP